MFCFAIILRSYTKKQRKSYSAKKSAFYFVFKIVLTTFATVYYHILVWNIYSGKTFKILTAKQVAHIQKQTRTNVQVIEIKGK